MLFVRELPHRWFKLLCVSLALVFLAFDPVHATEPTTGPDQPAAKPKFIPARPPSGGPVRKEIRRRPNDHTLVVLLRQYDTLQATIQNQMELSPDEAKKIEAVIDYYRNLARDNQHMVGLFHVTTAARFHGGALGPNSEAPQSELHNPGLASTALGFRSAEDLPEQVIDGFIFEYHDLILGELYFAIDDKKQRDRIWPIMIRWLTLQRPPAFRDDPLLRVFRAARDTELDLGDEEHLELLRYVSTRTREHMRDRFNYEVTGPAADQLRRDVAEKLEPRQREHFLQTVKMLNEEAEIVDRLIKEWDAKKVAKAEKPESEKLEE